MKHYFNLTTCRLVLMLQLILIIIKGVPSQEPDSGRSHAFNLRLHTVDIRNDGIDERKIIIICQSDTVDRRRNVGLKIVAFVRSKTRNIHWSLVNFSLLLLSQVKNWENVILSSSKRKFRKSVDVVALISSVTVVGLCKQFIS